MFLSSKLVPLRKTELPLNVNDLLCSIPGLQQRRLCRSSVCAHSVPKTSSYVVQRSLQCQDPVCRLRATGARAHQATDFGYTVRLFVFTRFFIWTS